MHVKCLHFLLLQMKKDILASLRSDQDPQSVLLLFATEAFGMGADVSDICRIIHVGPPMTMESK